MFRLSRKPKHWFATTLAGVGVPVLLVALVLAAATPSSGIYPAVTDAEKGETAGNGMPESVAVRNAQVTIDLAGWELYLHSTEVGLSNVGLPSSSDVLPPGMRFIAKARLISAAAPLPVRPHYRSQAPPA